MMLAESGSAFSRYSPSFLSRLFSLSIVCLSIAFLTACGSAKQEEPRSKDYVVTSVGDKSYYGPGEGEKVAILSTEHGKIAVKLFEDVAPNTVSNFCYLAGKGFYDGLIFYRVVPNFVLQTGDPHADGTGGPGYRIPPEIVEIDSLRHTRGIVAMDISEADVGGAGSRFYICLSKQPQLDGRFPVFGKVIDGNEVLDRIREGDRIESVKILLKSEYVKQREKSK
jgi:peptidyl-prolyl cis-trans isomerase B (cyclophilin B)